MSREHYTWTGSCPDCGKRSFTTRKAAKKAARRIGDGDHMSAYRCGGYWHIGHLPTAIIRGHLTRTNATRKDTRP